MNRHLQQDVQTIKMIHNKRFRQMLAICIFGLMLSPAESFFGHSHGHGGLGLGLGGGHKGGHLNDLLAASLIGLVLSGVRSRVKQQQERKQQQPLKTSANHQQPMFLPSPWQSSLAGQYSLMQATQGMPVFHPQLMQQSLMPDMSSWLSSWNDEQLYQPLANELMHSFLAQPPVHRGFRGFDGLDSGMQHHWDALESQAIRSILAFGAQ